MRSRQRLQAFLSGTLELGDPAGLPPTGQGASEPTSPCSYLWLLERGRARGASL